MIFVVRVDDVGWTAEASDRHPIKKPDAGLFLAQKFHAAMQGVPWLAAIVPAELDEQGVSWIRSAPAGMVPALHGWNHECQLGGEENEFWGLTREQCRARLKLGLEKLGVPIRHFVPPFNALDQPLVDACADLGLEVIWGRPEPEFPIPKVLGRVMFVPSSEELYGAAAMKMGVRQRALLDELPSQLDVPGVSCLTLHLPWEAHSGPGFQGVKTLASMIKDRAVDPDGYVSNANRWRGM